MSRRLRVVSAFAAVALVVGVAACSGGGAAAPTGATGAPAAPGGSPAAGPVGPAASPITSEGPMGWDRGPYDLAGGTYELSWESDGTCTALYFGIVGVDNGFKETPSTAGDVPLAQIKGGSRLIENVPPGRYFFNVSGLACKTYSGTLTPKA